MALHDSLCRPPGVFDVSSTMLEGVEAVVDQDAIFALMAETIVAGDREKTMTDTGIHP